MRFGDIIENGSASRANPQRLLMFVRSSGRHIETLSIAGNPVKFYAIDRNILSVVMPYDTPDLFDQWRDRLADQLSSATWWRDFCDVWSQIGRAMLMKGKIANGQEV